MKNLLSTLTVALLVVGLSACGGLSGSKGGVDNTGVEKDGTCSKNVVDDVNNTAESLSKAVEKKDAKEIQTKCEEFAKKYATPVTCIVPKDRAEAGATYTTNLMINSCARLNRQMTNRQSRKNHK